MVFWVGLILFCFAFLKLFEIVWMIVAVFAYPTLALFVTHSPEYFMETVPSIVGSIIFMVIGIVMMRSERRH